MYEALQHPHLDEASFDEVINGDRRPWRPQDYKRSHEPSLIPSSGFSDDDLLVVREMHLSEDYELMEVETAIATAVRADIKTFKIEELVNPGFATERALIVYGVYASDTKYSAQDFVGEYFIELSKVLLSKEVPEATDAQVESLLEGAEALLKSVNFDASVREEHLVSL